MRRHSVAARRTGATVAGHRDYALRLFDAGMICLPLRSGQKHLDLAAMGYEPVHLQTRSKTLKELAFTGTCFHFAQQPPSRDMMAAWFAGFSGNIGILTGSHNLLVLDFDTVANFERWRDGREALVNSTPVAQSPSGFHVYLRSGQPVVSSSLHFGMRRVGHAKALGGYVVASPSILKSGGAYAWLPGRSPLETSPVLVEDLASISLLAVSPLKHVYDRMLGRGSFTDG